MTMLRTTLDSGRHAYCMHGHDILPKRPLKGCKLNGACRARLVTSPYEGAVSSFFFAYRKVYMLSHQNLIHVGCGSTSNVWHTPNNGKMPHVPSQLLTARMNTRDISATLFRRRLPRHINADG
jgi:hypothetical protein